MSAKVLVSSSDTEYLWNLINPVIRFLILNQTRINSNLEWNITQKLETNPASLDWDSLPEKVQVFLLAENSRNTFQELKFRHWGWVTESSVFADFSLKFLLKLQAQEYIPHVIALLAPLSFDSILDKYILTQNLKISAADIMNNVIEMFNKALGPNQMQMVKSNRMNTDPSALEIVKGAYERAKATVVQYVKINELLI